jgi:acetoin utilization deacetylase AcuC-like enzyme/GNAT superfamily N-acetyltransferase
MFRVRRIHNENLAVDRAALEQVEAILRAQFPGLDEADLERVRRRLREPFGDELQPQLWVVENQRLRVAAFALLLISPRHKFGFLDFIAVARSGTGGGVGGALYERVRDAAAALGCRALFFECHTDEPHPAQSEAVRRQNAARLRFYERYGARPLEGSRYDEPVNPEDAGPAPLLVIDPLGGPPPSRRFVRTAVRTILEVKYGYLCPPDYVERVVQSVREDPVQLRPPRYAKKTVSEASLGAGATARRGSVTLVVNDRHDIHHVRDRGYVEAPVRISRILSALEPSGLFRKVEPRERGLRHIEAVHDPRLVRYLRRASAEMPEGRSLYPYVFPLRNPDRPPRERSVLAGYYCIDTFTPIHRNSFPAAKRGVDCTLRAADALLEGERLAYSLVRPPGHHAERRCFGGFCYFNNAAVAAHYLVQATGGGPVAILDCDYHHGNGQQDIFYRRRDVLTVSIHGHPRFAYPYFAGFEDERGEGEGTGFNLNIAMPEKVDGAQYHRALRRALARVAEHRPLFLVVALGLDPAAGDPTGTWSLRAADFAHNGRLIGELSLPTLVVQEGGYRTRTLGSNALAFFTGLTAASPH